MGKSRSDNCEFATNLVKAMSKGAESLTKIREAGGHKQFEGPQFWTNVHHLMRRRIMLNMMKLKIKRKEPKDVLGWQN